MSIEIIVYEANVKVGKGLKTKPMYMVCDSRFPANAPKQIESIEGVIGYCRNINYDIMVIETDYEIFKKFWDTYGQNHANWL